MNRVRGSVESAREFGKERKVNWTWNIYNIKFLHCWVWKRTAGFLNVTGAQEQILTRKKIFLYVYPLDYHVRFHRSDEKKRWWIMIV